MTILKWRIILLSNEFWPPVHSSVIRCQNDSFNPCLCSREIEKCLACEWKTIENPFLCSCKDKKPFRPSSRSSKPRRGGHSLARCVCSISSESAHPLSFVSRFIPNSAPLVYLVLRFWYVRTQRRNKRKGKESKLNQLMVWRDPMYSLYSKL